MSFHVLPPEWEPHRAVWMAWPYRADEWPDLEAAQREHLAFVAALAETELVDLLVHPSVEIPPGLPARNVSVHRVAYGDAWTRDTAPLVTRRGEEFVAQVFDFNGWGGRYRMEGDAELGDALARSWSLPIERHEFVLEGGAIDVDGAGHLLTTRSCLLDPNREPPTDLEARLRQAFGVREVIWLEGVLENDHTDGHVDTLARFVAPGHAVCMRPEPGDPNEATLASIERGLRDAGLEVSHLPAPGDVGGPLEERLPASYCNFYIANEQVLVPQYGIPADDAAVEALRALFPARRVRGVASRAILEGGGALHCITQQQPGRRAAAS